MEYPESHEDNIAEPVMFHLNVMSWNCRGIANNQEAISTIHDAVKAHRPGILIITETRMHKERIRAVVDRLPFDLWEDSETIVH